MLLHIILRLCEFSLFVWFSLSPCVCQSFSASCSVILSLCDCVALALFLCMSHYPHLCLSTSVLLSLSLSLVIIFGKTVMKGFSKETFVLVRTSFVVITFSFHMFLQVILKSYKHFIPSGIFLALNFSALSNFNSAQHCWASFAAWIFYIWNLRQNFRRGTTWYMNCLSYTHW